MVLDWEDKASLEFFVNLCWERHLKGELRVEDADLAQFTRVELTRKMAKLFERTVGHKNGTFCSLNSKK